MASKHASCKSLKSMPTISFSLVLLPMMLPAWKLKIGIFLEMEIASCLQTSMSHEMQLVPSSQIFLIPDGQPSHP
jgi:hypothetical protein